MENKSHFLTMKCSTILQQLSKHSGLIYGIMSGLNNASEQFIASFVVPHFGVIATFLGRYILHTIICICAILICKVNLKPAEGEIITTILKSIFQSLAILTSYFALKSIPLVDCIVVNYGTMNIYSVILARFMLKEHISCYIFFIMSLIFSGVIICCHPTFIFSSSSISNEDLSVLYGYLWATIAGLCNALCGYTSRKLINTSALLSTFYCGLGGMILDLIIFLIKQYDFAKYVENPHQSAWIVLLGIFSVGAIFSWGRGLQISNMVEVCLAVQIEIPFGIFLQVTFGKYFPEWNSIVGGLVVVLGVVFLLLKDYIISLYNTKRGIDSNTIDNSDKLMGNGSSAHYVE